MSCGDKISSCLLSNQQVDNLLPRVKFRLSTLLCGDKISSCRSCKLKTCSHMGKLAPHLSLWRQDFILSILQVGKLAPTWKNLHQTFLWRQDFHLVEGMCKLKTRTHMGKLAACCGDGTQRTRFQKADQTAGKRCRNGCVICKSRARSGRCPSSARAARPRPARRRCRASPCCGLPGRSAGRLATADDCEGPVERAIL